MEQQRGHRNPGDMEVGFADIFLPHEQVHLAPRSAEHPEWLLKWEAARPKWLMEMIAEAFAVALYCFFGMNAAACFFVASATEEVGFGSLQTVGFAYGFGVMFAIIIAAPTSGGHLAPSVTVAFALFKGFPWRKVPQYIFAQLFGGFFGSIMTYFLWKTELTAITAAMVAKGPEGVAAIFSPSGPAGIFALFPPPGTGLGYVFLNEFIASSLLGTIVFGVLDPANHFVSPVAAPALLGLFFFSVVVGLAPNGMALNTARDLGGRFAAACIWGTGVFPARYTAIAALTNFLALQFGAFFQIVFLGDSIRPMTGAALNVHTAQSTEKEAHLQRVLTGRTNMSDGGLGRQLSNGLHRHVTPNPKMNNGSPEVNHIETKDSPV